MCQGSLAEAARHGGSLLSRPGAEQSQAERKPRKSRHFWDAEIQLRFRMQSKRNKEKLFTISLPPLSNQKPWNLKFPFKILIKAVSAVRHQQGWAQQCLWAQTLHPGAATSLPLTSYTGIQFWGKASLCLPLGLHFG